MWNKELSDKSSSHCTDSDPDDDNEVLSETKKKDGIDDSVKESDNPPPNFSLDYTLDDLYDQSILGEQVEITEIRTTMQLKKIKTGL